MAIDVPDRVVGDATGAPNPAPDRADTARPSLRTRAWSGTRSWLVDAGRPVPLSSGLSGRRNALGVIRFVLAAAVIVSHSFPLSGNGEDPFLRWSHGQQNLGGFAVIGFFAISGYLIAKSGARNDILQFAWARVLRIFPAFLAVLLMSAFVVGPIAWKLMGRGLRSYFTTPGGPFSYLANDWTLTIHQWGIFDIFSATPYGRAENGLSAFNGSLWTLTYEWTCYVLIGAFVLFGLLRGFKIVVPILAVVLLGMQIARVAGASFVAVVPWLGDQYIVSLGLIFMIGATFAMYADRIVLDYRLFLFCAALSVFTARAGGFEIVGYPAFAYMLFWLAAKLPDALKRLGSKNDYSYGLYLWGFLVQQIVAALGWYHFGFVAYLAICLVFSVIMAWLSWHGLEKHALAIKGWGPGRGIRHWYNAASSLFRKKETERARETKVGIE
ncbi:acyltransferase family protein [Leifsonia sp. EB34]|uniref:acyltransferase family protein n=1 Tax=Leifsonia sp. EB34 TaxID=3156303 RepID=UPI0035110BC4